jgi:hypothetical protein
VAAVDNVAKTTLGGDSEHLGDCRFAQIAVDKFGARIALRGLISNCSSLTKMDDLSANSVLTLSGPESRPTDAPAGIA